MTMKISIDIGQHSFIIKERVSELLENKRLKLSKDLSSLLNEFFSHDESLLSFYEQSSENRSDQLLEMVYKET